MKAKVKAKTIIKNSELFKFKKFKPIAEIIKELALDPPLWLLPYKKGLLLSLSKAKIRAEKTIKPIPSWLAHGNGSKNSPQK